MDLSKKHRYTTWATDTLFFIPFNVHQCIADIGCICLVNEHIRGTEESWFTSQSITDLRLNLNDPNTSTLLALEVLVWFHFSYLHFKIFILALHVLFHFHIDLTILPSISISNLFFFFLGKY